MSQSIKSFFKKAPFIFYFILAFHLYLTFTEMRNYWTDTSVSYIYFFRPFLYLLYTLAWLGVCFMKKWAGLAYLILTFITVNFHLFIPVDPFSTLAMYKHALSDVLFTPIPVNLLFCFFILFYFKRIQAKSVTDLPTKLVKLKK